MTRLSADDLRRLYSEGWSVSSIAKAYPGNGSDHTVARRLARAGVRLRSRAESIHLTCKARNEAWDRKAAALGKPPSG